MQIDVQFNARNATVALSSLRRGIQEGAVSRALNKTAVTVRAEAARAIVRRLGRIKVGDVRKSIQLMRSTKATLVAKVVARGLRRIPLTSFGAVQTRTGVRVRVLGKVYTIPHAYIRARSGGRDAVRIRAQSFRAQLVNLGVTFRGHRVVSTGPDYPIAEIMVPGLPLIFVENEIQRALATVARTRFATVIAQEVRFELAKVAK